ncbi:hypothetical protein LCGC14_0359670 [marine sediment metagenome]|uniref:LamG-like jellyroll fold domain-containing protein n=1 Tax=marine sediment metagenome TaxID=412755 RepID=A0A0F9TRH7_9ZZZZ|nr:hypothetical protein [Candidatus Aminicenantes bacterium]
MKRALWVILLILLLVIPASAAKIYDIWEGFQSGELTPYLDGQVGLQEYSSGAKTMENFFPREQGPVSNRSGFRYVAETKTSAKQSRIIPFEFSTTQAYIIELGDLYARFFANEGQIQDPDANTLLLIHANEPDATAGTSIIDTSSTGRILTAVANAQTDESKKQFGNASFKTDGTGDWLTVPNSADFDFSGGTFTYESWAWNDLTGGGAQRLYSQAKDGATSDYIEVNVISDGTITVQVNNTSSSVVTVVSTAGAFVASTWQHVAVVENGNDWFIFVSGVDKADTGNSDTSRLASDANEVVIGGFNTGSGITAGWNGWQDEIRVSDVARYTANFVPQTVEHGNAGASPYEIVTTYIEADLARLQFTQSGDTMYIVHPDYPPRTLTRTGHANWTIADLDIMDGLFYSTDEISGSTVSAGTYNEANLIDNDLTTVGHTPNTTGDDSGDYYQFVFAAAVDLAKIRIYVAGGAVQANFKVQVDPDSDQTHDNYEDVTGATVTMADQGIGWIEIEWEKSDYTNASQDWRLTYTSNAITAGNINQIETYSVSYPSSWGVGSFPSSIVFFENRLWFAYFQTLWASASGDYNNLRIGSEVTDAMEYTIGSDKVNTIQWLSSGNILVAGTAGGEYKISASNVDQAITPLNLRIVKQSSYGSEPQMPVQVRDVVLYLQRNGRKIREFTYEFQRDLYVSPDLTLLAEHVTESRIKSMAYQAEPFSILWAVRNDGDIAAMTYRREQGSVGWSRHTTDGDFEYVAVIPSIDQGNDYDELWAIVKRTINGSVVRNIELLQPVFSRTGSIEDAFIVDSGFTYDGVPATAMSGLSALEGEEVSVLADGISVGATGCSSAQCTVSSGAITLDTAASKVHIGMPYISILQTMRYSANSSAGTVQGRKKRINQAVFRLLNTKQFKFGNNTTTLNEHTFDSLFSGDWRLELPKDHNLEGYVVIKNDQPLPITVIAIMPEVNIP